jgi:dCTP deaminase
MLLSDQDIIERLCTSDDKLRLIVCPIVNTGDIGAASIDVHLGTEFRIFENLNAAHIDFAADPKEQERQARRYSPRRWIDASKVEAFHLHPGEFALGGTLEFVRLPLDLAGRIEGRSSYGRLGLHVHVTAGFVDPGFSGTLTFELHNSGKLPISLYAGLRIGQLCFFKCGSVLEAYAQRDQSKYPNSIGTVGSRYYKDKEVASLYHQRVKLARGGQVG